MPRTLATRLSFAATDSSRRGRQAVANMESVIMGSADTLLFFGRPAWIRALVFLTTAFGTASLGAEPAVEFDFAPLAAYREVEAESVDNGFQTKLVEVVLPISVRFRGVRVEDVHEIDVEIDASEAGLSVYSFSPTTQLHSDVVQAIHTTTTSQSARSFDATLGGELPVPVGDLVAHVTPSISAGVGSGEVNTEKLSRLPPKEAIVVSGTSSQGQGVFFKLKRSSQTSLEGVHELSVSFVVPEDWRGGEVRVACTARGQRKVLWIDQPTTFNHASTRVQLYRAGDAEMRESAERRAEAGERPRRPSLFKAAAAEIEQAAKDALGKSES